MFRSMIRRVMVMWPSSPGATYSCIAAASPLACRRSPPAPGVRVTTPIPTSRTTNSSKPSPRIPDAVFTPIRGGRTGMSTSGVRFVKCEGALVGSVARWPLRGSEIHRGAK